VRKTFAGVVSGQAGAGKSFFMRNLYINLAKSSLSKVPIFLEARELNASALTDFAGLIATAFRTAGQEFSKEQAAEGLKSGGERMARDEPPTGTRLTGGSGDCYRPPQVQRSSGESRIKAFNGGRL
jgi:hypothetical protein